MYVPRTGRRSLAGSRVLANDLEQIPTATICVDGSTIFEEDSMFGGGDDEEARRRGNGSVVEVRILQPIGSSALLDTSVWAERLNSTGSQGSNSAKAGGAGSEMYHAGYMDATGAVSCGAVMRAVVTD